MLCNEKLRKELIRAVVFTVFFTALFIVLCMVCLFIAEDPSPALRVCLVLAIPFALLVGGALCLQFLKTVHRIEISDSEMKLRSLLTEKTYPKPNSVAIEINFGKITLHAGDGSWKCRLYSFSGGSAKLQTPFSEFEAFLRENNIAYYET